MPVPLSNERPYQFIVSIIVFAQFAVPLMMSGTAVALPQMAQDLNASAVALGLVQSIYIGTSAALVLTIGRLADTTDKASMFKVGLLLFSLTTFAIGFMPNISQIIAARALQGATGSIMATTGMAIIMHAVPAGKRGRMIGLSVGSIYAGMAGGPLLAGFITAHLGWRFVFILVAVPSFIGCLAAFKFLESRWRAPTQSINIGASLSVFCAVMLLVFGSGMGGRGYLGVLFLLAGAALLAVFVLVEARARVPLVDLRRVAANHSLRSALLTQMLLYCSALGTNFLMSLYLQDVRSLPPQTVGAFLLLGPLVMAFIAPLSGRLSDRHPPWMLAAAGVFAVTVSLGMALAIDIASGIPYILAILILQGIGFALFSAPNLNIIMHSVHLDDSGMAAALSSAMRTGGMLCGMLVINLAMSWFLGDGAVTANPQGFLHSMVLSFTAFLVLSCAAVALALQGRRGAQPKTHE